MTETIRCDECGSTTERDRSHFWWRLSGAVNVQRPVGQHTEDFDLDFCSMDCAHTWLEKRVSDG